MEKKPCVVEVFSRVTGFFRPVQVWNKGKQAEFSDRGSFNLNKNKEESDGTVSEHSATDSRCSTVGAK
jgi:hypothetical protein